MAEEATVQPSETTGTPPPAEKPTRTYTQADLDSITEKVRKSTEAAVVKRIEDEKKAAEMTETERHQKKAAEEADARQKAERDNLLLKRQVAALSKVTPGKFAPPLYVDTVIKEWPEDQDFDADKAMNLAAEKFTADTNAYGVPAEAPTKRTTAPAGGAPVTAATNLSQLSDDELSKLALTKGAKYYEEHIRPEFDRRRHRR